MVQVPITSGASVGALSAVSVSEPAPASPATPLSVAAVPAAPPSRSRRQCCHRCRGFRPTHRSLPPHLQLVPRRRWCWHHIQPCSLPQRTRGVPKGGPREAGNQSEPSRVSLVSAFFSRHGLGCDIEQVFHADNRSSFNTDERPSSRRNTRCSLRRFPGKTGRCRAGGKQGIHRAPTLLVTSALIRGLAGVAVTHALPSGWAFAAVFRAAHRLNAGGVNRGTVEPSRSATVPIAIMRIAGRRRCRATAAPGGTRTATRASKTRCAAGATLASCTATTARASLPCRATASARTRVRARVCGSIG